ncbi:hypothetical protein NEMBOFW57_006438 [Staphylotrichum longicolle]|uniref:Uncharacterized protein n=1 Tax=Staphylotrichum longicolle TaxID=669026 RepID=A0AAD4HZK6_9PEZI|nr:hypothetical protein NEMBOFW57_006438 [Staphylotrichum longicolle]
MRLIHHLLWAVALPATCGRLPIVASAPTITSIPATKRFLACQLREPPWPKYEASQILAALDKYQIAHWGFVIFRCTYASEEKWDKFLAHLRELAQEYFQYETGPTRNLHETMAWTVIEDAEMLDGADILQTSRIFDEWVTKGNLGKGLQEMRGSRFNAEWHYSPRYTYFLHVDEESLESVVDDEKRLAPGGYFCTVVRAENVLIWEKELLTGQSYDSGIDNGELDDESLRDHRKRVRVDDLMSLYGVLQEEINVWYRIYYIDPEEEIGCYLSYA